MFYLKQKVFDYLYGWGKIIQVRENSEDRYLVKFNDTEQQVWYTKDGVIRNGSLVLKPTLSTTEYCSYGFSQEEESIDYEDCLGNWGRFYEEGEPMLIGILNDFEQLDDGTYYLYPFFDNKSIYYKRFVPLTDEEITYMSLEQ